MAGAWSGQAGQPYFGRHGRSRSARTARRECLNPEGLAGSTLTPFQGAFLAERMAGIFLEDAWAAFSTRPASLLHFKHGLFEGNSADFCLISPEKTPYLLATYHRESMKP